MSREPTIKATKRLHVRLDGRRFVVEFSGEDVLRIKERKKRPDGTAKDFAYWCAKHHPVGGLTTTPARVISKAHAADRERLCHGAETQS